MENSQLLKLIEVLTPNMVIETLTQKISLLESDLFIEQIKNEQLNAEVKKLNAEVARLNELLTPKAKGEFDNE